MDGQDSGGTVPKRVRPDELRIISAVAVRRALAARTGADRLVRRPARPVGEVFVRLPDDFWEAWQQPGE